MPAGITVNAVGGSESALVTKSLSCVLLADRHHGLTEGVRGLLATAFGSVVMVADEASLIEGAGRLQPDMAIVDLSLAPGQPTELVAGAAT